jgi:hypothetical protein
MQLRSGRSTLRRDSRNNDEFNERRRYQEEQKRIEECIYEDEREDYDDDDDYYVNDFLAKEIQFLRGRTRHILYLNQYQKANNHSLSQKVKTILELYELYKNKMNYMIEYYKYRNKDKRFPEMIYKKGIDLHIEINQNVRTRRERLLALECCEMIMRVVQVIHRNILDN